MIGDSGGKGEFRGKEMVDGATLSPWIFGEVSVVKVQSMPKREEGDSCMKAFKAPQ
jgi:hypothetical protein